MTTQEPSGIQPPLYEVLHRREAEGRPVRIGLVGAGQMGTDIVSQVGEIPGLEVPVVADIEVERAVEAYAIRGVPETRVTTARTVSEAMDALGEDRFVVTDNAFLVPRLEAVDVVLDVTGVPEVGAELGFTAIQHGKHLVMMNVEADVFVGPILRRMADRAGVVYTGAAGDEPGSVMELYGLARNLGFEVVAAGKGKNNPLDRGATPGELEERAREKGTSVKKLTSFVDGTNTMIEMTAVSNATGLVPDVEGMHGPAADIEELAGTFALEEQGGILERSGVVDYTTGNLAPGVFLVFTTENPRVRTSLKYNKMGPGPNYLLYRPYHLISLESVLSAARAVCMRKPTMRPGDRLVSETVAVAKEELEAGEELDGIGGYKTYGTIVEAERARSEGLLPMGLAEGGTMRGPAQQGELLKRSDVEMDTDSFIYKLRSMQETLDEQV